MNRPRDFLNWAIDTFGPIAVDPDERVARFVEEALELAHACDMPVNTITRIVSRVYSRPAGQVAEEVGRAMATLECLAENIGISADAECDREFERVKNIPKEEWQRRHAAKVKIGIAS